MTILAIGDSFTFGAELFDVPKSLGIYGNEYFNETTGKREPASPSQYAWPTLLANKIGTNVVNLGLVGGSNDRIFRLAVKETAKEKFSLVICAWTGIDRFDFALYGKEIALSVGVADSCREQFPWITEFVDKHYSRELAEEKWLTQLITLQSYFASINQPYVFVKSLHIPVRHSNFFLNNKINLQRCIDWNSSLVQWCKNLPMGPGKHFLEEGHELVAEKIFRFLQEKEL